MDSLLAPPKVKHRIKRSVSTSSGAHYNREILAGHNKDELKSRSGSQTPHTFGLGVPGSSENLEGPTLKKKSHLLVPEAPVPDPGSGGDSGTQTPAVVLTPAAESEGTTISSISFTESERSSLEASRDDLTSPPLERMTQESDFNSQVSSSILRLRSRSGTVSSQKSVDFSPGPPDTAEVLLTEEALPGYTSRPTLSMDTNLHVDADPTFHRSLHSPLEPVEEANVERVGRFDVSNLRRDSYGNLPKVITSPSSSDVTCQTSPTKEHPDSVASPSAVPSLPPQFESDSESTILLPAEPRSRRHHPHRPEDGKIQPSTLDGEHNLPIRHPEVPLPSPSTGKLTSKVKSAKAAIEEFVPQISFPQPTVSLDTITGKRKPSPPRGLDNPNWCPTRKASETTAITYTEVYPEHQYFTPAQGSKNTTDPAEVAFQNVLGESSQPPPPQGRKSSFAESIRSVTDILWKDDSKNASVREIPVPSRRSSAWAKGKGSLGLVMDDDGAVKSRSRLDGGDDS
ncbi:hypothetical protein EDC01DRAFT_632365 [Geopyxis carbonaria]|nr:hypothetical protein EDC01DRAFT_632365 [Geopyxis carbonaria]